MSFGILIIFMVTAAVPVIAFAGNFMADVEAGRVLTGYNDVQIPADRGTRFSLKDDIRSEPENYYRLKAGYDLTPRHSIFFLYAPLTVKGDGRLGKDVSFNGHTFPAGEEVKSTYRFDSYRLTWLYAFVRDERFIVRGGITGKVRDAEITISGPSGKSSKSNTGFVPLLHLQAQWFATPRISLLLDGDGLASPQGRAEDFLLAVQYHLTGAPIVFRIGYRILEGGSSGGGRVYTFALFHYFGAGVTFLI